jgi:ABC-type sugar transport system substrate-binding protein
MQSLRRVVLSRAGKKLRTGVVLGAAVPLLLTACGSSSSSGSAAAASSSSSAQGGSAAAASPGVAQAKAFIASHQSWPALSTLGFTASLKSKPPTGKVIDFMECGSATCTKIATGIQQAATALGWTVHNISAGTSPTSVANAWTTAASNPPDGIIAEGFPQSMFASQLATLSKAGVPVINGAVPGTAGGGVDAIVTSQKDFTERGTYLANWVVGATNGKADTAFFGVPDYPVLATEEAAFKQVYNSECPSCALDEVPVALSAIGTTLTGQVVSYVRAHPQVNYLVMAFSDMELGIPQALASAGLSNQVKVVTQADGPANLQYVKQGQAAVAIPEADYYIGWQSVDALARYFTHTSLTSGVNYDTEPRLYVNAGMITNPNDPNLFEGPPGYQAMFKKLWLLGS